MAAARDGSLQEYRRKRDFSRTREPSGEGAPASGETRFVVQKHDASRLHYDFRLEMAGVLKSWAIPKGPSLSPRQKRLAMPTEDHPIAYLDFEGTIPEDQYGGGTVMVWDIGTYQQIADKEGGVLSPEEALARGRLRFRLVGRKLQGGFALTRTGRDQNGRERWILVKMRDEWADDEGDILVARPESALSGRSLEQIAEGEPARP